MLYLINLIFTLASFSTITDLDKAQSTMEAIYENYSIDNTCLLKEYNSNEYFEVSYLASESKQDGKKYSYLWPFSGTFSAICSLYAVNKDKQFLEQLNNKILVGLEKYFDKERLPAAYSSYIVDAKRSDRFYDDNIWIGIDFVDTYMMTSDKIYLDKALLIWEFIMSGYDDKLGGGIYWCEQKKESKNTCSNAPASVFAVKLFNATNNIKYLTKAKELYKWTKEKLKDKHDGLYYDKIFLDKRLDKVKFAYNSGQMMQAAVLLYEATKEFHYLKDAQNLASACSSEFFLNHKSTDGKNFKLLKSKNIWFSAIMMRGFMELYRIDNNIKYLIDFKRSLDYAWIHARDDNGLFCDDLSGNSKNTKKWLLTQTAYVEMYSKLSKINFKMNQDEKK